MLKDAEGTGGQLGHVRGVEPAVGPKGVRVGAPDGWVAVDEPLGWVDAQAVEAGGFAVDLNVEGGAEGDEARSGGGRVQAEGLLEDGGRVGELAAEDTVGFAGLAEDVCC